MAYINGNEVLFSPQVHTTDGGGGVEEYIPTGIYNKGDIVHYGGLIYTPLSNGVTGILPTDTTAWADLTSANREYADELVSETKTLVENETNKLDIRVTNLEQHLSPSFIETDEDSVYQKIVPVNACPYAQVNKVGGMSYKTRNLIPFPYNQSNKTTNGITFATSEDGAISINGTSSGNATLYVTNKLPLTQGKTYTITGNKNTAELDDSVYLVLEYYSLETANYAGAITVLYGESKTFTVGGNYGYTLCVRVKGTGVACNNITFCPMINEGSTALPYELYFEGLRDTKVTELKSEGVNLFNFDNVLPTLKGEGNKIVVNSTQYNVDLFSGKAGQSLAVPTEYIHNTLYLTVGIYYIYYDMVIDTQDKTVRWLRVDENSGAVSNVKTLSNGSSFNVTENGYYTIRRSANLTATISNLMITRVQNAEYKPYKEPITFPISAELRKFLEPYGYGRGVEGYPNYIDFERKVFVQNTYREVFDGTENWTLNGTKSSLGTYRMSAKMPFVPAYINNKTTVQSINSHGYISRSAEDTYNGDEGVSFNATSCLIYDKNYNTDNVDAWKAHLAELYANDNPLIVEYALATPIETDISAYLTDDNFIEVDGGGSIVAVNEHKYDVPSSITYMLKESDNV